MTDREEELRFARRLYLPRAIGLLLGCVAIGAVLRENGAPALAWAALGANALLWPHLAHLAAARSRHPRRTELRSLAFDSACGGAWLVAMDFNLLPSQYIDRQFSFSYITDTFAIQNRHQIGIDRIGVQ